MPTKIRVTHDESPGDPIPLANRTDMYPMGIYEAVNKDELEKYIDYITGSHARNLYQTRDEQGRGKTAFKSCRILQERVSFNISPVTTYYLKESLAPTDFAFVFPDYHIPDGVYDWSVYKGSRINGYWDGTNRSDFFLTLDSTYDTPKWVFRWLIHPAMWIPNPFYESCSSGPLEPSQLRVKYALKGAKPRWIQIPQTSSVNDINAAFGLPYEPSCEFATGGLGIGSIYGSNTEKYKNFVVTNAKWDYPITIPKLEAFDMCQLRNLIGLPDYTQYGVQDVPYYRVRTQNSWDRSVPELQGGVVPFPEELPRTTRLKIEVLEYVPHPICVLLDALNRCDLSGTAWESI